MINSWAMRVILNNNKWFEYCGVFTCGYCFTEHGELISGEKLCCYFSNLRDEQDLITRLRSANGLFSVVIYKEDKIIAATDRVRRYPLFFTDNTISDSPQELRSSGEWDELGLAFYKVSGSVLPGHTLLKDILQVAPASYVVLTKDGCQTCSYASYLSTEQEERDVTVEELDTIMMAVFQRLIESVGQRQLVIPLTAGNDSRLILSMLHRLHYSNVICYTIDGAGGDEWNGAHEAAERMGYAHYKIDMQDASIRALCNTDSEDFERYYRYVGTLTNFCWLADYTAVRFLKQQHIIADDAVFVPGHSGDMIGGSHLTKARVEEQTSISGLVKRMCYVGFEYGFDDSVQQTVTNYFKTKSKAGYTSYSAYQNWIVQHRQAHNILNSIRVYDFYGYDVRLPLWDNALYDLFSHLPFKAVKKSRLYTDYVTFVLRQYALPVTIHDASVSWLDAAFRKNIKKIIPQCFLPHFRQVIDPVGEIALSYGLGEELTRWLGHPHTCTNGNELLLKWYLMRVSQGKG